MRRSGEGSDVGVGFGVEEFWLIQGTASDFCFFSTFRSF